MLQNNTRASRQNSQNTVDAPESGETFSKLTSIVKGFSLGNLPEWFGFIEFAIEKANNDTPRVVMNFFERIVETATQTETKLDELIAQTGAPTFKGAKAAIIKTYEANGKLTEYLGKICSILGVEGGNQAIKRAEKQQKDLAEFENLKNRITEKTGCSNWMNGLRALEKAFDNSQSGHSWTLTLESKRRVAGIKQEAIDKGMTPDEVETLSAGAVSEGDLKEKLGIKESTTIQFTNSMSVKSYEKAKWMTDRKTIEEFQKTVTETKNKGYNDFSIAKHKEIAFNSRYFSSYKFAVSAPMGLPDYHLDGDDYLKLLKRYENAYGIDRRSIEEVAHQGREALLYKFLDKRTVAQYFDSLLFYATTNDREGCQSSYIRDKLKPYLYAQLLKPIADGEITEVPLEMNFEKDLNTIKDFEQQFQDEMDADCDDSKLGEIMEQAVNHEYTFGKLDPNGPNHREGHDKYWQKYLR